jgi:hypothetical protein
MKTKSDDAAFSNATDHMGNPTIGIGLTKREYFASMVLQGLCVPCHGGMQNLNDKNETMFKVSMAVRLADALIDELNRDKSDGK